MKLGYFANQNDLGLKKPFQQVMAETREIARTCGLWRTACSARSVRPTMQCRRRGCG